MIPNSFAGVSWAFFLALAVNGLGNQHLVEATFDPLGGAAGAASGLFGSAANAGENPFMSASLGPALASHQAAKQAGAAAAGLSAVNSALPGTGPGYGESLKLAQGMTSGLTSGFGAGMSDVGRSLGLGEALAGAGAAAASGAAMPGFSAMGGGLAGAINPMVRQLRNSAAASTAAASQTAAATAASSSAAANDMFASGSGAPALQSMMAPFAEPMALEGPAAAATGAANAANTATGATIATNTMAAANNAALAATTSSSPVAARTAIALDAMKNAQTESALAGSEMVAQGANNARSAAMASNAYRNAKLASARDRVNIAGAIQNAARISDATIATHDAATKAEDSLLGSELAVDSASTVLDSDGAYIPPVTSSLLRSLPYGRLGLRNIIPKPLTHPSPGLPDVWLNGIPVRYGNVPMRFYPPSMLGFGPYNAFPAGYPGASAAGAPFVQPFTSNNGVVLNGMVFDPAHAYLTTNLNGVLGTSVVPILANGQIEAQDELAMANLLQMQQLNGVGMSATYQGYGRLNPVPMITGSVTDANLMPTTTIGTTYPIGSTLVIEPRDSFFQDYNDNASSRQNYDERQQ